jgi:hypothetical protein
VRSLEITDRRTVRRIAALVDGLPFAGGPNIPVLCPPPPLRRGNPIDARLDTFRFRASPTSTSLATASLYADTSATDDPCAHTSLSIRGHRQQPIADGGALLTQAGAILSVKLAKATV